VKSFGILARAGYHVEANKNPSSQKFNINSGPISCFLLVGVVLFLMKMGKL